MSQRSSDVPILVNVSIYIYFHDIFTELVGIIKIILREKTLTFHRLPLKSETFKKSQMSEPIDVPSWCNRTFCENVSRSSFSN